MSEPGHLVELCEVCKHPDKRSIEQAFISWMSPRAISKTFKVKEYWVRHHADCKDLVKKRRMNCLAALDKIVELGAQELVRASEVVQAVTAMSKINDEGRWVDKTENVHTGDLNISLVDYSGGGNGTGQGSAGRT